MESGPRVYECAGSLKNLRSRVTQLMRAYNDEHPTAPLNLILFDDALRHLARICRVLSQPRGSALLVGVGGSGKQSLARLAAVLCDADVFTMSATKGYAPATVLDDVRVVFRALGRRAHAAVLLITDNDIKDEAFLETVSQLLFTGNIQGLLPKDEVRFAAFVRVCFYVGV